MADDLGHFGQEVSKNLDLKRLTRSFSRDKPTANRGIPSWSLSLILLALTKAAFLPVSSFGLQDCVFQ